MPSLTPGSVDLLVLPEMALSGYVFNTPASILPYLEPQRIGPTSLLCRSIAKKLRCCVIAGYPEKLPDQDEIKPEAGSRTQVESATDGISNLSVGSEAPTAGKEGVDRDIKGEALGVGYNSATVVDKNGEVVGNYRKTFRFETDKNWAREGEQLCFWVVERFLMDQVMGFDTSISVDRWAESDWGSVWVSSYVVIQEEIP